MATTHLLSLLCLLTGNLLLQQTRGWSITVPHTITALEGSCVVVPCKTEPHSRATWYQYHNVKYPVVFDEVQPDTTAAQFRRRTSVLGKAEEGDCTLMIDDVRQEDNNIAIYVWINPDSKTNQRFFDQTVTIVVVRRAPVISIQKQIVDGEVFQANCSLFYSCPFSPPSINWDMSADVKNSRSVISNKEVHEQWLYTNTLYGLAAYQMHNSQMRCTAMFKAMKTGSRQITLSILYKPVSVTLTMRKEAVIEGDSIITECAANSNPQPHSYSWLRRHMGQINEINSTQRKVSFRNIKRDTSLSCIAHNQIGVEQSGWLDLDVQYAPAILPESSCHLTGELLRCFCLAEAHPPASIHWRIDGNETVQFSINFVSTKKDNVVSGEISGPAKRQTNVYCTAWNSIGNESKQLSHFSKIPLVKWLPAVLVVGSALLFGTIFVYRKYCTNSPASRSHGQDTQSALSRTVRYAEVHDPNSVYDNDFLEEVCKPTSAQHHTNSRLAPRREGNIWASSEYCNMSKTDQRTTAAVLQMLQHFYILVFIFFHSSIAGNVMELMMKSEVILSVYIISFLIGLPANLLALYAFSVKIHSKPLPTDILLLSLTVSDLLFLIVLPLKIHEAASGMIWNLPYVLCTVTAFTFFSAIYTSSLLLMAVSVVRYISVAFPITYHQLQKPVYAIVISVVIWIISAAHCSIVIITQHLPSLANTNASACYENFTEKQLEVVLPVRLEFFFVLCLIPLLICIYCYLSCICILYSRPRISPMKKQKAIGMALGTLAVFLICVVPFNISHAVGYFEGESAKWRDYALLLSSFNTCIDPIIFYFSSSSFQCSSEKFFFRKQEPAAPRSQT